MMSKAKLTDKRKTNPATRDYSKQDALYAQVGLRKYEIMESSLANDETATDADLLEFFISQGVDKVTAKKALKFRGVLLKEPNPKPGLLRELMLTKVNPAPRIGAAKPGRKSQKTGAKPSMRLVQRRKANTKKGYYPNPIPGALRYLVSVSPTGTKGVNPDNSRNWFAVATFVEVDQAKKYAEQMAASHPKWSVQVTRDK